MSLLPSLCLPLALALAAPATDGGFLGVFLLEPQPRIDEVIPDSPAARSGLRKGDLFVSVDGKKTPTTDVFLRRVKDYDPGDRVRFVPISRSDYARLR